MVVKKDDDFLFLYFNFIDYIKRFFWFFSSSFFKFAEEIICSIKFTKINFETF